VETQVSAEAGGTADTQTMKVSNKTGAVPLNCSNCATQVMAPDSRPDRSC